MILDNIFTIWRSMMKKDKQTKHKFALLACVLALAAVLGACGEKEPVFTFRPFSFSSIRYL